MPGMLKPRIAVIDFQEIGSDVGRGQAIAEDVAIQLEQSGRFQVTIRPEWLHLLGGIAPSHESRAHPGWASHAMMLTGSDAIVLGCVYRIAGGDERVKATLLDSGGIALTSGERNGARDLVRLLTGPPGRAAIRAMCPMVHPVEAQILAVQGSSLLLKAGRNSAVRQLENVRVDRVLEAVADPYSFPEEKIFSHIAAGIGEAQVIDCNGRFVVLRYSGDFVLGRGDEIRLTKV